MPSICGIFFYGKFWLLFNCENSKVDSYLMIYGGNAMKHWKLLINRSIVVFQHFNEMNRKQKPRRILIYLTLRLDRCFNHLRKLNGVLLIKFKLSLKGGKQGEKNAISMWHLL
ncbi:hypothetical protein O6H91_05G008200 [Diphasiastrum complanatum]|uniref:Uncharacterized protein n=1 Tax=Diphasiastrum complanatum TaxID=34168 RepID=A0ACC2DKN4_DIPCM|nr:hypothetical protein O6H91_05G008200 [Diphasiastrum complanatum]